MNRRRKKKKKKGEEYKAPQELQRTETSIYRGGTRAEEWQASTLYLEHNCAHSNTNKHAQTYAYWYTFGSSFSLPLLSNIVLAPFLFVFLSSSPTSNLNIRGPKKIKNHLQPSTGEQETAGERQRWGDREVWLSVGRSVAWHIIWRARLNLYPLTKV